MAAPFRVYNSLTREVEDFEPIEAGKIRLYVCGNTVYDHCHVGHACSMVVFDAIVRYLRHRGWDVTFVRNFTDVDDKIIRRANEIEEEPLALAKRFIDAYHADADALGLIRPDEEPRVSTSIDDIQRLVGQLVERGHAYVEDGTVWFSVATFDEYGQLSGQKVDELRSADDAGGKRDPADFALWKAAKPSEPTWPSPWGPGRPGWHIECSAMAMYSLGNTFDIHGGGLDLIFPHHENEIAQSRCGSGQKPVNYWMHHGLLTMATGQKMGKSLGNVINVHLALEQFPAEALRLYYLQNHYRSSLPWNAESLPSALGMLARLYEAREKAEEMGGSEDADRVAHQLGKDALEVLAQGRAFEKAFHGALDNDFNTGQALGHLFKLARAMNRFAGHKKARKRGAPIVAPALAAFRLLKDALGLVAMDTGAFHEEVKAKRLAALGLQAADIEAGLAERAAAREAKDWARADALREELEAKGVVVMDTAGGVEWRLRLSVPE